MAHITPRAQEDADQVHVDVLAEAFEGRVAQRADRIEHARVVDPEVDQSSSSLSPHAKPQRTPTENLSSPLQSLDLRPEDLLGPECAQALLDLVAHGLERPWLGRQDLDELDQRVTPLA
jgi:DNA primase large subunit